VSRVLALVTDAYGGQGGIAQAARDVIGGLASNDAVEAIDVLPRHAPHETSNLPNKVRQHSPESGRISFVVKALRSAVTKRPDWVFCNHLYMAPLAAIVATLVRAKLIVQLHGIEIWKEPSPAQRKSLERANLILCVSRDTRARALTHCDLTPERAVVVNNTVDPRFAPGDRASARAKFGLRTEFVILIVGRLDAKERYKGHDLIIQAIADLPSFEERPVVFLIAGDGDDRKRIQHVAEAAGVADRTVFLGLVPNSDLPDLYRAADLFALPSTGEGFGIVYLEAMACGTPSLGLAAGGVSDALANGELGVLVAPDVEFALALRDAITSRPVDPVQLSAEVLARYGANSFTRRLASVLELMH